eukprot:3150469-Pyramimonas_sp.AAC.1
MRNCRHFRGLPVGPAERCTAQTRAGPRRPWGAAVCETVAAFEGCWWVLLSEAPHGSERDLAVPEGLRSAKLSPLSRAAGGSCG